MKSVPWGTIIRVVVMGAFVWMLFWRVSTAEEHRDAYKELLKSCTSSFDTFVKQTKETSAVCHAQRSHAFDLARECQDGWKRAMVDGK